MTPSKKNVRGYIKADARTAATRVVHAVRYGHQAVQAALDATFAKMDLEAGERPFATELVYGCLRNYIRLEWFLRRFLARFDSLPIEMRSTLCVAVYELFFTRVPAYATVNSYVGMVRNLFGNSLGKVANGVLRNADRNRHDFFDRGLYEDQFGGPDAALACWYSVPEWLVTLWKDAYGDSATKNYLEASVVAAPNALRFDARKQEAYLAFLELLPYSVQCGQSIYGGKQLSLLRKENCLSANSVIFALQKAQTAASNNDGIALRESTSTAFGEYSKENTNDDVQDVLADYTPEKFASSPMLFFDGPLPSGAQKIIREGLASQQSAAAQDVLRAMQPEQWRGPVWDCCCGRGGKTLALLEQGVDVVLASDVSKSRLRGLRQELERTGIGNKCVVEEFSATQHLDESAFYAAGGARQFGTIIIDAPCSGFGTLARHPEIRFRRSWEDVERLVILQRDILCNVSQFVAPGGSLVYITCTLTPQENENQVAFFIQEHPEFIVCNSYRTPYNSRLGEFFYGARLLRR